MEKQLPFKITFPIQLHVRALNTKRDNEGKAIDDKKDVNGLS